MVFYHSDRKQPKTLSPPHNLLKLSFVLFMIPLLVLSPQPHPPHTHTHTLSLGFAEEKVSSIGLSAAGWFSLTQ